MLGLLGLMAGCPTREVSELEAAPINETRADIPVQTNRNVDILFVIDNSDSMFEEQERLRENFPRFIDVLSSIEGGLPNVHIGVVSSDVGTYPYAFGCTENGDNGQLQYKRRGVCSPSGLPGCVDNANCGAGGTCNFYCGADPVTAAEPFIKSIEIPTGGRDENFAGTLPEAFSCMAALGTRGCGLERHLDAVDHALDFTLNPANAPFLRPDAFLAVIVLADEDDCSAGTVLQGAQRVGRTLSNGQASTFVYNPEMSLDRIDSELGFQGSFRCTEFGVECDDAPITRTTDAYESCKPRTNSYMQNPQAFVDMLKAKKGGQPGLIIGAVIGGNTSPFSVTLTQAPNQPMAPFKPTLDYSCTAPVGEAGAAVPAIRLKAFVDAFGQQGRFTSVCNADLTDALDDVARLLAKIVGSKCLGPDLRVLDVIASEPGLQLPCTVTDVQFQGTANETQTVIRRCDMIDADTPDTTGATATNPCWWVAPAASCATFSDHSLALVVERGLNGDDAVPIGTKVQVRCEAE